jgi:hypothetical protein
MVTKSKLTQVKKDLEQMEERYSIGKIETLIYTKYSEKYREEISILEEKLSNPNLSSSNLDKCIKSGLKIARKLSKIWVS